MIQGAFIIVVYQPVYPNVNVFHPPPKCFIYNKLENTSINITGSVHIMKLLPCYLITQVKKIVGAMVFI